MSNGQKDPKGTLAMLLGVLLVVLVTWAIATTVSKMQDKEKQCDSQGGNLHHGTCVIQETPTPQETK